MDMHVHVGKSTCSSQPVGVAELWSCALDPALCFFQPHRAVTLSPGFIVLRVYCVSGRWSIYLCAYIF